MTFEALDAPSTTDDTCPLMEDRVVMNMYYLLWLTLEAVKSLMYIEVQGSVVLRFMLREREHKENG